MTKLRMAGLIILPFLLVMAMYGMLTLTNLYPPDKAVITEKQPEFHWQGRASQLLIDDNQEFSSPIMVGVEASPYKMEEELDFGTYWWKVEGVRTSKPSQFTIESLVSISLKESEEESNITNTGNTEVEVEVAEQQSGLWKVTGNIVLEEGESFTKKLKWLTLFSAKQK